LRLFTPHLPLLFILLCSTVEAAVFQKRLTQFHLTSWSQEQGLPSSTVLSISQSSNGYLWLGTTAGLIRFDGVRFSVPAELKGLRGSAAIVLCQVSDRNGIMWMGTNGGGLLRFDGKSLQTFNTKEGLPSPTVNTVHFDARGVLWIGTARGLVRFESGRLVRHPVTEAVWSICDDPKGGILVATFGRGVVHVDQATVKPIEGLPSRDARTVFRTRSGTVWVSVPGQGVFYSAHGKWVQLVSARNTLLDVWSIVEDPSGKIWIGAGAGGLSRWDGQTLETLTEADGLAHAYVLHLLVDAEGSIWAGARSGLTRLRNDKLTVFTKAEGLTGNMLGPLLEVESGHWLIGTQSSGAAFWNRNSLSSTSIPSLKDHKIFTIYRGTEGRIWLGTDRGLAMIENYQLKMSPTYAKLPSPFVFSLADAGSGQLWIGTLSGLCLYRAGDCESFPLSDQIPKRAIFALHVDRKNALWLGYSEGGLCRYDNSSVRCWGDEDGFDGGDVFDLKEDERGAIWAASMNGLARIDKDKIEWLHQKQGLPFNSVYGITVDRSGDWWLSSGEGLFQTSLAELRAAFDSRTPHIQGRHFTRFDGMLSATATAGIQPAASLDGEGNLWFPTNRGAVFIKPKTIPFNQRPAPAVVEEVVVDGKILSEESRNVIPPGARNVEIHYTALSLMVPERVQFEYQLEGFDKTWVPAGDRRVAFYTGLPPGSYSFRVRATNNDGLWGVISDPLKLQQQPHLWQSDGFRLVAVISIIGLIWLWNKRRLELAQQRFDAVLAERTRIARDLHDTLLGDFTGFSMQLGAMAMDPKEVVPATAIDRVVTKMENSLREARDAIQLLRSGDGQSQNFLDLLKIVCHNLADSKSIPLTFATNGQVSKLSTLSSSCRDCLYRVVVEAVRNAVKHSGAKCITVELHYEANSIRARVSDDGCGFDANKAVQTNSFGLKGMSERAKAVQATFQCHSSAQGTSIEISMARSR
jgi:ligand-binding sensor domain-containing protein/signal transduction histidine kinase